MIANLITTIMVALGVATGNVSSNQYKGGNAFNHETTKQQIKKAVDSINIEKTYELIAGPITYSEGTKNVNAKKYIVDNYGRYIYVNDYMAISNTTYTEVRTFTNSTVKAMIIYSIYQITNYYNSNVNYTFTQEYEVTPNVDLTYRSQVWVTKYDITNMLDLTLTPNTLNTIDDLFTLLPNEDKIKDESFQYTETDSVDYSSNSTGIITLGIQEPINICFKMTYTGYGTLSNIYPKTFQISGSVLIPETNYEVVDIPNLMFTILTLPFAWYSTAFNLTVFTGTPYQLNFGNLVMTIVAALILLYLIRKIIK